MARTARLSASATAAALWVLAEHGYPERDGWWSLDDPAEYNELCRWPVILDDAVRAPPGPAESLAQETA